MAELGSEVLARGEYMCGRHGRELNTRSIVPCGQSEVGMSEPAGGSGLTAFERIAEVRNLISEKTDSSQFTRQS